MLGGAAAHALALGTPHRYLVSGYDPPTGLLAYNLAPYCYATAATGGGHDPATDPAAPPPPIPRARFAPA